MLKRFSIKFIKITPTVIPYILCLLLLCLHFQVSAQQVVQIKVFSEDLKPYGNIGVSLNSQDYIKVPVSGVAFANLSEKQFPVKSISVSDDKLEVATWNLSKGILEMTIRKKSYRDRIIWIQNNNGEPVSNAKLKFQGIKTIETSTNSKGQATLALAMNESISGADQFKLIDYDVIRIELDKEPKLIVEKSYSEAAPINELLSASQDKNWDQFVTDKLTKIDSLEQFYAFLKNVPQDKLSQETQNQIDKKFNELLDSLRLGTGGDPVSSLQKISDSTSIGNDIDAILEQVNKDKKQLSAKRVAFEEKIKVVRNKLNIGFENLSNSDKDDLLEDINLLDEILSSNQTEFIENQESYRAILNELKRRFFNLKELENKLNKSEEERLREKKKYQQRILAILSVVLLFALLIILLFYLRNRLKKQQKELILANKEVKVVNENLETLVSDRTQLLEKTFKELDLVLYRASHDLRAPICSIAGLSDLIERDTGNSELTDLVLKTNQKMDKLLKKLSTVSEIHHPGQFETFKPYPISKDIINNFEKRLKANKLNIELDCDPNLEIISIKYLFEVILHNLIENAVHFSSVKKEAKDIQLKLSVVNNELIINVQDHGIGIDKSILPHVEEMFFVGTELSGGNGLGLYLVNKSVTVLKGNMLLVSENDLGTTVTVTLPLGEKQGHALDFVS